MPTTFKDDDLYLPLEQVCAGFVRGEYPDNLVTILKQTECVRVHSMQEKDKGKEGSKGYYFRFVRLRQEANGSKEEYKTPTAKYLEQMVNSLYSTGANYGALYFIPLEQACDLNLNFANSLDAKGNRGRGTDESKTEQRKRYSIAALINSLTGLGIRQLYAWISNKEYRKIRTAKWEKDYNKGAEINFSIPNKEKITVIGLCENIIGKKKSTEYLPKFQEYLEKISNTDNVVRENPIEIKGKKWYFLTRTLKEPRTADSSVTSSDSAASSSSIASSSSTSSSTSTMST